MSKYRKSDTDGFAAMFGALSNPQRLRIFLKLVDSGDSRIPCEATAEGMRHCVGELGAGLDLAASTVSHHIKELRDSGLLQVERRGQKVECWISGDTLRRLASFFLSAGGTEPFSDVSTGRKGGKGGRRKR